MRFLADLSLFVEVANTRNFGRAAAALGMPASTLSRRISDSGTPRPGHFAAKSRGTVHHGGNAARCHRYRARRSGRKGIDAYRRCPDSQRHDGQHALSATARNEQPRAGIRRQPGGAGWKLVCRPPDCALSTRENRGRIVRARSHIFRAHVAAYRGQPGDR
jgi:hypothetical protein